MNIYPGVYTAIGTSITPVAVTLDLGGDSRTIVPVLSSGNMYLSGFSGNNSTGGAQSYHQNGYPIILVSSGSTGITLSGNVTSTGLQCR